jgi:hypothetical protein
MNLNSIDVIILGRLYDRPNWAKSLYRVKARLTVLVNAGLVERCAPVGNSDCKGTGQNMVKLTPKGHDAIEAHWNKNKRGGSQC